MPTLFTKPIDDLAAGDVQGVIGWPESLSVEFKKELPTKDGRPDAWLSGGKVGEIAREKLLKEVVAFANTVGGHLVLGIDEDRSLSPRTARAIAPIPRCVELAERLSQMAEHVDPPVPLLLVRGIPTDENAGVVVFRVPQSRAAPHRSPDLECYVRRGTESVPVGMREIQAMASASSRGSEWTERRQLYFEKSFQDVLGHVGKREVNAVGVRVTATPLLPLIELGRLFEHPEEFRPAQRFRVNDGAGEFNVHWPRSLPNVRPAVRGVKYTNDGARVPTSLELYSDGCCSVSHLETDYSQGGLRLHLSGILACVMNVLSGVNFLRRKAQTPDLEYRVDLQLGSVSGESVELRAWGAGFDDGLGFLPMPLSLPSLSYGTEREMADVVSALLTDLRDASGSHIREPIRLQMLTLA